MHRLLDDPSVAPYELLVGRDALRESIASRTLSRRVRLMPCASFDNDRSSRWSIALAERRSASLHGVINATGMLLHTNLGRAPLAREAFDAVAAVALGYSNLEFDLATRRSWFTLRARDRRVLARRSPARRTRSSSTTVPPRFCWCSIRSPKGREVFVARNQLIEIGGGFRLPDVLARSGATLVEVGTTNKVYLEDLRARALAANGAADALASFELSIEGFVARRRRARARRVRPAGWRPGGGRSRQRCPGRSARVRPPARAHRARGLDDGTRSSHSPAISCWVVRRPG